MDTTAKQNALDEAMRALATAYNDCITEPHAAVAMKKLTPQVREAVYAWRVAREDDNGREPA